MKKIVGMMNKANLHIYSKTKKTTGTVLHRVSKNRWSVRYDGNNKYDQVIVDGPRRRVVMIDEAQYRTIRNAQLRTTKEHWTAWDKQLVKKADKIIASL